MNYTGVDLASLAWLLPELQTSLISARAQLAQAHQESSATSLNAAKRLVHDAAGALQVLDAQGIVHYVQCLESALAHCASLPDLSQTHFQVLDDGCYALMAYLGELQHGGQALQPLVLFPYYEAICHLNPSSEQASACHPADLYFPALSARLDRSVLGPPSTTIDFKKARNAYEALTLQVFNNVARPKDLEKLSQLMGMVAESVNQPTAYSFWKTCQAMMQALVFADANQHIEFKRWLARLNLQMRRLSGGSVHISERLFREALYHLAQLTEHLSPLQQHIVQVYELKNSVPTSVKQRRYLAAMPSNVSHLLEKISVLKRAWDESSPASLEAEGLVLSTAVLLKRLANAQQLAMDVQLSLSESNLNVLVTVAQALAQASQQLLDTETPLHKSLGLEGAQALLWLEHALSNSGISGVELLTQAQTWVERIHASQTGLGLPLKAAAGAKQEQSAFSVHQGVMREAMSSMVFAEKRLDEFFRKPQDLSPLQAAIEPLQQTSSALDLLELPQAVKAIRAILAQLQGFIAQPASANQTAFLNLAQRFGQVTQLLDVFTHTPDQAKQGFVFNAQTLQLEDQRTLGVGSDSPFESIESLTVQHRANTNELLKEFNARPQDLITRQALVQSLKSLRDDAEITGDIALSEQVSSGLNVMDKFTDPFASEGEHTRIGVSPNSHQTVVNSLSKLAMVNSELAGLSLPLLVPKQAMDKSDSDDQLKPAGSMDDLHSIFIEEARSVLLNVDIQLALLEEKPADFAIITDVRRAFHTLKGSARMVGFTEFGDAAWHVEQVINNTLAKQEPVSMNHIQLMSCGKTALDRWLNQLDDALLDQPGDQAGKAGAEPLAKNLNVASHLAGFKAELAPYLISIERAQARQNETQQISAVKVEVAVPDKLAASPAPFPTLTLADTPATLAQIEPISAPIAPVTPPSPPVLPVPPPSIKPKISLVSDNTGQRPQDFIDKARSAVREHTAQAAISQAAIAPESFETQLPAVLGQAIAPTPPSDSMVSVGPLRLPKQLFNIYLQESQQHLDHLLTDLNSWKQESARPSHYDAYRYAHSLKGTAATIGFEVMRDIASPLEQVLYTSQSKQIALNPADLNLLGRALSALQSAHHSFAKGLYPAPPAEVIRALLGLHHDLLVRPVVHRVSEPALANIAAPLAIEPTFTIPSATSSVVANTAASVPPVPSARTEVNDFAQQLAAIQSAQALSAPSLTPTATQVANEPRTFTPAVEAPQPVALASNSDDVADEIDADIWHDFVLEADSIMPRVHSSFRDMPYQASALKELRRDLHTLKGSSRMAGAMRMGAMLHALETQLDANVRSDSPFVSPATHAQLIALFDDVDGLYTQLKTGGGSASVESQYDDSGFDETLTRATSTPPSRPDAQPFLSLMASTNALFDDALKPAAGAPTINAAAVVTTPAVTAPTLPVRPAPLNMAASALPSLPAIRPVVTNPAASIASHQAAEGALALPAMRMRTDVLDRLVNQATEVASSRGRLDIHVLTLRQSLKDLTENIDRLRKQLREIEIQAESQMSARVEVAQKDQSQFDPLEFDRFTRFQELTRMLTESLNDMIALRDGVSKTLLDTERDLSEQSKATKDLTQSLMRSRLVAFDVVSDRLYRVVRQSARELGKTVTLDVVGGHILLDRSILERITSGLEHLVRNSVVHGLEKQADRLAAGKAPQGTISIHVRQQGNELDVTVSDDGAGLPLQKIRELAQHKGLLSEQAMPTVEQLTAFIFEPGFSTAESVTELAGRGIGMDVVRSDIVALGGRITVTSTPLQNTRFNIRIPLTLAINQVLMVMAGEVQYAVPTTLIESVVSLKPSELAQAYNQARLMLRGVEYGFTRLSDLLGERLRLSDQTRSASVLLLSNGLHKVAVYVDSVIGNQEAVVKPLSPLVLRIPGLSSATLLSDGRLCLIVDPVQMWPRYAASPTAKQQHQIGSATLVGAANSEPANTTTLLQNRRIAMVIDDSLTVRKVTQKLLLREGWEVLLAKDGIDALEQLQSAKPAILLVDIEMPRMDGFDLTRNVRADDKLKTIPIIMITSRIADKHREHAFSLGVNAYMGKPYRDDELLAEMSRLTALAT